MKQLNFIHEQKYERAKKRVRAISGFYKHFAAYLIVNVLLLAMKYYQLEAGEQFLTFGTFSTAIFWGIGLFFHGFGVFGVNAILGQQWEERKINELIEKEVNEKYK